MNVLTINEENFEEEILNSKEKVLVDFYANWCGPCQTMSPVIDEIANENTIKIGKVNIDENEDLARKYDIMTIPTIMVVKNGEIEKTFIGVTDKNEILEAF